MSNGRRQPSRGGTSRMTRECQVRICERLGVKFPGPTRHRDRGGRTHTTVHVRFAPKAGCEPFRSTTHRFVAGVQICVRATAAGKSRRITAIQIK
jgi:hypothetical protein